LPVKGQNSKKKELDKLNDARFAKN
jgi:hypothetical protein